MHLILNFILLIALFSAISARIQRIPLATGDNSKFVASLMFQGGKTENESLFTLRYWTKRLGAIFKKLFSNSKSSTISAKKESPSLKPKSTAASKSSASSTSASRLQKVSYVIISF